MQSDQQGIIMKKLDISPKHIIEYIYDQSVDIEKRTFVLFSVLTLLAIFVAVPCGLITNICDHINIHRSHILFDLCLLFDKERSDRKSACGAFCDTGLHFPACNVLY